MTLVTSNLIPSALNKATRVGLGAVGQVCPAASGSVFRAAAPQTELRVALRNGSTFAANLAEPRVHRVRYPASLRKPSNSTARPPRTQPRLGREECAARTIAPLDCLVAQLDGHAWLCRFTVQYSSHSRSSYRCCRPATAASPPWNVISAPKSARRAARLVVPISIVQVKLASCLRGPWKIIEDQPHHHQDLPLKQWHRR